MEGVVQGENTIQKIRNRYKSNPDNQKVALDYALKLLLSFDYAASVEIYEKVLPTITNDSLKSFVYLHLGDAAMRAGQTEKSIKIWRKGIDEGILVERREEAMARLGNLLFQEENYEAAIHYLQMVPKDFDRLITLGVNQDAMRDFEEVPNWLGISYLKIGEVKKGREVLNNQFSHYFNDDYIYFDRETEELKVHDEKNWPAFVNLAFQCVKNDVFIDGAFNWVEKALPLTEDLQIHSYVLSCYAFFLDKNQEYEKAIEFTKKLIEITEDERFKESYEIGLVFRYAKAGNEKPLEKLIVEAQNDPEKLVRLAGGCNRYKIRQKDALVWMKKAIELDDGAHPTYLYAYAELLFDNEEYRKAFEMCKEYVEKSPPQARGFLKRYLRKYERALKRSLSES